MSLLAIARVYSNMLERRPLITKGITSGLLFGMGDSIAQKIDGTLDKKWDKKRTMKMAAYGACVFAPATHLWYVKVLGRTIPGISGADVAKKVAADQLIFGPVINSVFLGSTVLMDGGAPGAAWAKIERNIWPVMLANWTVWPFAVAVNFRFVPLHYQVLFINVVVLGWSSYLCLEGNKDKKLEEANESA
eukprot:GFYU01016673.1.p1 GENE.GFYU01016673.1~~GFYU01016673.1.p1  ORF type:complete len:190 (+),score=45.79 GFYU01016673.1:141-710(+)